MTPPLPAPLVPRFVNSGYRLFDVPWRLEDSFAGYDHPIPELQGVTSEMLVHDVQDMQLAAKGWLGCRVHPDVSRARKGMILCCALSSRHHCHSSPSTHTRARMHAHAYAHAHAHAHARARACAHSGQMSRLSQTDPLLQLDGQPGFQAKCNSAPGAMHPHSYHSTIWYNTNVWAAKRATVNTAGSAALADPSKPLLHGYLSPTGMSPAGRPCRDVPRESRLAARCTCLDTDTECKEVEAKLAQLDKEDKLNVMAGVDPLNVQALSLETW